MAEPAPHREPARLRRGTAPRDAAQRAAELLEIAPVAFLVTDELGVVRQANAAAGLLLNVPTRHLLGKPLVVYVADAAEFRRRLNELRRDDWSTLEWRLVLSPRQAAPFHASVVTRLLEPGQGTAVAWVLQSIQPLVSAEQELRLLTEELEARVRERTAELDDERALLRTIVRDVPAGLVVADASTRTIVYANEQAEAIFERPGMVGARLAGSGAFVAYHLDGRRLAPEEWPLARALAGEPVSAQRVEVERPGGTRVTVEVLASPLHDHAGEIRGSVAVVQDVTERVRLERAEREFVSNAAHELQTPIAAITSAAEVLVSGAKDDPHARDHFLGHILRESARLTRLARALLALARAQSGVEPPRRELVEVAPLLEEVAASLPVSAAVAVEVDCPAALALVTNRDLAAQALANLATNALKFTRDGRVVLRARPGGEGRVVIDVSDTGPGIPAHQQERVFDRFYRGPAGEAGGFGLGLAITREAVEVLGGTIEVARTGPGGTTFRIALDGGELVT